ncbi:unnamed protein product [Clonostachys chloroleuca]|uniref:intramembrane prenyl-peptidase Rce1 n=1 Tax=Clonostachys chloroleuca TaxID=1926264 RepID=A0AA35LVY1_9HYPO|nr:unnamed protein product [Clonostachys chloroleuca]
MANPTPDAPVVKDAITQTHAFGCLLAYCVVYVLPLHLSPATRATPGRSRDDPGAIRARIKAVSLSTAVCSIITLAVLTLSSPILDAEGRSDHASAWHAMGYWPLGLRETARSVFLTALLFAAPLYERLLIDGAWEDWLRLEPLISVWNDMPTWRNLVVWQGPITEECLFRSAAVPLLLLAGNGLSSTVFLSPLVFGVAHVHHFYEFRVTHPGVPLVAAIARSVLQFSYTYLFGIYATFIFLRTGSLLAVILVHSFCNVMGLPRVWGLIEPYWLPEGTNNGTVKAHTGVYYLLLFGGMFSWWQGLYALTSSSVALADL